MNDNFGTLRAELNGCAIEERDIEDLGLITAAFADSDASIDIYDIDTQGSMEDFMVENGDYFILSYYGDFPNIRFMYHTDGTPQGDIFNFERTPGKAITSLKFNPHDDFITGTIDVDINNAIFSARTSDELRDNEDKYIRRTFAVYLQYVKEYIIDVVAVNEFGTRSLIRRMFLNRTMYGTVRKMVKLSFGPETAIASFSKGRIPVKEPFEIKAEKSLESYNVFISEDSTPAIKAMYKSVLKPNKIFNTEANI